MDAVVVVIFFVLTGFLSMIDYSLYWTAGWIGIVAWLLVFPLLVFWLRGHSTSLRTVLLAHLLLGVALPISVMDLGITANSMLDFQTPTVSTVKVRRVWCHKYCYVRLAPWGERTTSLKVTIPKKTYDVFDRMPSKRRYAVVTVQPGLLGFPWWTEKVIPTTKPTKSPHTR